jgi:hypothetical protein
MRIDARPLFRRFSRVSLSMIAAAGLASRSTCSRHLIKPRRECDRERRRKPRRKSSDTPCSWAKPAKGSAWRSQVEWPAEGAKPWGWSAIGIACSAHTMPLNTSRMLASRLRPPVRPGE